MNARATPESLALPIRLTSPYAKTIEVTVYGVPMTVSYEYDEGEPPLISNMEFAHPGTPANATLLQCFVNGVDITELLNLEQQERIEETILEKLQ